MDFSDRDPRDAPEPQTVDEATDAFGPGVMTLVPQVSVTELGVSTVAHSSTAHSSTGRASTMDSIALSYTLWRNPDDRSDPGNLAELADEVIASLDASGARPLPEWMRARLELMRYPSIWEGVMTTRLESSATTAESTLANHANHVLRNTFRELRVSGGFPGVLDSPVDERHIRPETLVVDGVDVPGLLIESDPHVMAVGAELGDRILTAVVARDHLPYLTLEFSTRVRPGTAPTLRIV